MLYEINVCQGLNILGGCSEQAYDVDREDFITAIQKKRGSLFFRTLAGEKLAILACPWGGQGQCPGGINY